MSTNANIGKLNGDGSINFIYLHFDGYPEAAGQILRDHYSSDTRIEELLALGSLSALGTQIGEKHSGTYQPIEWCLAYTRDFGHLNEGSRTIANLQEYCIREYNYLWNGTKWLVYNSRGNLLEWEDENV